MRLSRANYDNAKRHRKALFLEAKSRLPELKALYEPAHEQIAPQIDYLLAVIDGQEEGDRLETITVGVIAAKWLDPCPDEFDFLFQVANEARHMAAELKKASDAQNN